jgi:prepilin-type N-terminal cleavage/methylation domain-containing protein
VRARTDNQGFTLLELSIVLVIIAVVTGMAIQSGISIIATARLSATQQKMKAVDKALLQYRNATDRLPCPADLTKAPGTANYGVEAANPGTCTGGTPAANHSALGNNYSTVAEGAVPVTALGLPNDFMYDGWGNHFRYVVDVNMTGLNAFVLNPPSAVCGTITINDVNGAARSTGAIYALISHGPNGHGAYSRNGKTVSAGSVNANELINCHCNSSGTYAPPPYYAPTYVQADPSSDPTNSLNSFDDIVMYKEYWQTQTSGYLLPKQSIHTVYLTTPYDYVQMFALGGSYSYPPTTFGSYSTTGNGGFSNPNGIAIDGSGNVWVSDQGGYWVEKFSPSGTYISQIGGPGYTNGKFYNPGGVAIDATGNIWVVDISNNRVQEFSPGGTWLQTIPSSGCGNVSPSGCTASAANGQFKFVYGFNADGIAIDTTGNVWVADTGNNRIQEFSSAGTWLQTFPSSGCGGSVPACTASTTNGQFNTPYGIAIDSSNNIWIADTANNRVQELNSSGSFLNGIGKGYNGLSGSIGTAGAYSSGLTSPDALAISPDGTILVSGPTTLQVYNSSLQYACVVKQIAPADMQGVALSTTR